MASPQASEKFLSRHVVQMWDHDPGATSATIVSPDGGTTIRYVDMRDAGELVVAAMSSIATTGITKLEIIASASTDMSSAQVIKDSGTVAADAVGDWVVESCTATEIAQISSDNDLDPPLRYAAGRLTCGNSGDEAVVTYILSDVRFAYTLLTPATTIA